MTVLTDRYTFEREAVDGGLRAAVARLPHAAYRVASYHFGWADAAGKPAGANSGKALRPLLTLLAAKAVADDWRPAVPAAVAVELVHNFSLVHDDIIDQDTMRRHRPTVWKVFGVTDAILVGDALHALAFEVLAGSGHERAATGTGLLAATVRALVDGQLADARFEQRERVGLAECVAMAEAKTASLMACATALGALFAGGTGDQVKALREFGAQLGLAFQHVDDLLGIWGDPEVTGKAVYSDLRNRKKTLPVTAALGSGHPESADLARFLAAVEPLDEAGLRRAADLVDACGGRRASLESAESLVAAAVASLDQAGLVPEVADELGALAVRTIGRLS
ncbi:family 2 encapsulin nanocompartment cargo protein polyprenyl transferase [Myceligenerans halotolerans]